MSGNNGEGAPGRADRYWVEALEETGQNNRREEREEGGRGRREKGGKGRRKEGRREEGRREEGWKGRRMEGKKDGREEGWKGRRMEGIQKKGWADLSHPIPFSVSGQIAPSGAF